MSNFVMVFPGQGSQSIGMLSDLAKNFITVEETFYEASDVLGYNLWDLVKNGSKEELNITWKTQPAILCASIAIFRIWKKKYGIIPQLMAGHSLGEYSALVCAEVIDFKEAIKLVEFRGQLMEKFVPIGQGAMCAIIGLEEKLVLSLCQQASEKEVVEIVNFNSPEQVVIGGEKNAVNKAAMLCKTFGAKRILPLSLTVPSHCQLLKEASKQLEKTLRNIIFQKPKIDVINNVDVKIESSVEKIKDALVRQLYKPVRWVEIMHFIDKKGIKKLVEIGPGKVLTGLSKRSLRTMHAIAINDTASLNIGLNI
ncbi:ACP S-malonyltransferase [Arsenophonus symbiont of Ornithomya chloropus]|uniref:ACP S-malonyltransferase n=1 Tax=Arsenophonus symbiont of Ornithomya chloropus TaxID=634121 RepID=UPI0032B10F9B